MSDEKEQNEMTDETDRLERRAGIAAGLRKLATLIETTDVPLDDEAYGLLPRLKLHIGCGDREGLERAARAVPGRKRKEISEWLFELHADLAPGLEVDWWATRSGVCEARVVGTKIVKRKVPVSDPEYREVEEEVDVVEYDCGPVLSAATEEMRDE